MIRGSLVLWTLLTSTAIAVCGEAPTTDEPPAQTAGTTSKEDPSAEKKEASQVADGVIERIEAMAAAGLVSEALGKDAVAVIRGLLRTTRADQASIYTFVRAVNRNVDAIDCTGSQSCADFVRATRELNGKLLRSSYTDELFQNGNLSNQIKVRLPLLLEDSLRLNHDNSRKDFLDELTLLSNRFLRSRRFRVGLGLGYSYLPILNYRGAHSIDLSPFQSTISGGGDRFLFDSGFSDQSFPALILSASVPLLRVDAAFPKFKTARTTVAPVQFRDIDSTDTDILYRSTVTSNLQIHYDISAKFSVVDAISLLRPDRQTPPMDMGFGGGLTGFDVNDSVSTEVRFRSDETSRFNDLPAGQTLISSSGKSFRAQFILAFMDLRISDEFDVGIESRVYFGDKSNPSEVDIDGVTLLLRAAWYPTFSW